MACDSPYADANDFATFFCVDIAEGKEAQLNTILKMAATSIHAARDASGGCDCDLSEWGAEYLKQLNCLLAAATYHCPCSLTLSDEEKRLYMDAARADLELIRTGKTELCSGETAAEYPYLTWAERSLTSFNVGEIIRNELMRSGT